MDQRSDHETDSSLGGSEAVEVNMLAPPIEGAPRKIPPKPQGASRRFRHARLRGRTFQYSLGQEDLEAFKRPSAARGEDSQPMSCACHEVALDRLESPPPRKQVVKPRRGKLGCNLRPTRVDLAPQLLSQLLGEEEVLSDQRTLRPQPGHDEPQGTQPLIEQCQEHVGQAIESRHQRDNRTPRLSL